MPEANINFRTILDANTRYLAAQSEITERLAIRAQIQIYHIIVIFTVFAGVTAMSDKSLLHTKIAVTTIMPFLSTYFISLYCRNDERIGSLSAFNAALEAIAEQDSSACRLPRWFEGGAVAGEEGWIAWSKNSAKLGIWATIILSFASPSLILISLTTGNAGVSILIPITAAAVAIPLNIWLMTRMQWFRYEFIKSVKYDRASRSCKFPKKNFHFWQYFSSLFSKD